LLLNRLEFPIDSWLRLSLELNDILLEISHFVILELVRFFLIVSDQSNMLAKHSIERNTRKAAGHYKSIHPELEITILFLTLFGTLGDLLLLILKRILQSYFFLRTNVAEFRFEK
jgi:hypothetical protein